MFTYLMGLSFTVQNILEKNILEKNLYKTICCQVNKTNQRLIAYPIGITLRINNFTPMNYIPSLPVICLHLMLTILIRTCTGLPLSSYSERSLANVSIPLEGRECKIMKTCINTFKNWPQTPQNNFKTTLSLVKISGKKQLFTL